MDILRLNFIIVALALSLLGKSQTNLVPNPGFENTTPQVFSYGISNTQDNPCEDGCCTSGGGGGCPFIVTRNGVQSDYWSTCANWAPPFHATNGSLFSVASPDVVCENTRTGDFCGHGIGSGEDYAEYLTVATTAAMVSGHRYYFELWLSQRNFGDETIPAGEYGLGLHSAHPEQKGDKQITPPMTITKTTDIDIPEDEYILFSGEFFPNNTYQWISIGQFNGNSTYWILVDDVMIIDMGKIDCPNTLLLENRFYNSNIGTIQAESLIRAGFDVGFIGSNNDVVVGPQGTLAYRAGDEIRLEPGFSAQAGADFHAFIDNCASSSSKDVEKPKLLSSLNVTFNEVVESGGDPAPGEMNIRNSQYPSQASLEDMITVYPVPFNEYFTLNTSIHLDRVKITDLSGRIVWDKSKVEAGENIITLDNTASGIYLLEAHSNGSMIRRKINKQ